MEAKRGINGISDSRQQGNIDKTEQQQQIDRQLQSDELKDMHLESGEKINDYEVKDK